jgi:SulP family sulfate permease
MDGQSETQQPGRGAHVLDRTIPAVAWLRSYKRSDLRPDLIAGLTVAVMLVPQGMAYAMLAGLDPVVGLYASTLPLIAYALFGSSRHLAVGPVAMVSLLVMTSCSVLEKPGSPEYMALAATVALLAGGIQLLLGFLRMGFIVNFLSHAVISGFTSAAAIVICLSQLKHLLGVKLEGGESAILVAMEAARRLSEAHPLTLAIGLVSIGVLLLIRAKLPRVPGPLVVVVAGTLLVYAFGWDALDVKTVGEVPRGLPAFSPPALSRETAVQLAPTALLIVFVGYMESIAVAQFIGAKERYRVDPNAELRGLGLANVVAGLFSGYAVTGGFSRTAVNYGAGARTGLAAIVTAALVALTLLFLTPLFYYLPNAVLASIIVVAVLGLIDIRAARRFFRVKAVDGWTLVITFLVTLSWGIEQGILVGAAFSLVVFIWRSSHPHTAEMGYVEREDVFRDLARYPDAARCPRAIILRVDASLYFANMKFIEDRLRERLAERTDVKWVIVDLSGVNDIDAPAIHALDEIIETYGERGIRFVFAGMKAHVRDVVARAGWGEEGMERPNYSSLEHALDAIGLKPQP